MTSSTLTDFYHKAIRHLDSDPERQPLGGLNLFHCYQRQALRELPMVLPFVTLVLAGRKKMVVNQREYIINEGELVIFPANSVVWMENYPAKKHPAKNQSVFLSVGLGFGLDAIKQFNQSYTAEEQCRDLSSVWHADAPANISLALLQWFDYCQSAQVDSTIAQHRQVEFLLLLAKAGLAGNLLRASSPLWKQKVTQLVVMDMAHPWQIQEICERLALSESTLRRRLQREETSFRGILEDVRLTSGLGLLQETYWPIKRIADSVGYKSQARFSERFKQRFGISPSELRKTRTNQAKT